MKSCFYYRSELGLIGIMEYDGKIAGVIVDESFDDEIEVVETSLIRDCYLQIVEYLDGKRTAFELPLYLKGSELQLSVYHSLLNIAYGHTCSYKEVAQNYKKDYKGYQAVAQIISKNPISIIVPCHRVIYSDQTLGGYAYGQDIKRYLLMLEKRVSKEGSLCTF